SRRDRAGLEAIDAQQVQADRGPDDVDDRINGPDLVKVDLGQVDAVNLRLGLAQPQEDSLGQVLLPGAQAASVDERARSGREPWPRWPGSRLFARSRTRRCREDPGSTRPPGSAWDRPRRPPRR